MTEISGEWKALSYNQYRADIRSQSVSRSVGLGERGVLRSVVGPVPAQSGSICRPLFFYALFAALSSRNRRLLSSRTIFVRFLPHIFGTEERGGGSNSSDIVSQRLFWLSADKKPSASGVFQPRLRYCSHGHTARLRR